MTISEPKIPPAAEPLDDLWTPGPHRPGAAELATLILDGGTQARAEINPELVRDYAEAMEAGVEFPAVDVYRAGGRTYLADGFHRVLAARGLGRATLPARIYGGTLDEAILHGLRANNGHDKSGARRSRRDREQAIRRMLALWGGWSDRAIAKYLVVSHPTVAKYRRELEAEAACDEAYLAGCATLGRLEGEPARRFRASARYFLAIRRLPGYAAFAAEVGGLVVPGGGAGRSGEEARVRDFLGRPEPNRWSVCGCCAGTGAAGAGACPECRGEGLDPGGV
jgi:hypothetical protein